MYGSVRVLKDSETGHVLLQEVPDGTVAYRMVQNNPPQAIDFQSHYERGRVVSLARPFRAYEVLGVSVFRDQARAQRLVDTAQRRAEPAWIARLVFAHGGTAALWGVYKERTGHLEVFGLPQDLLASVDSVL